MTPEAQAVEWLADKKGFFDFKDIWRETVSLSS